MRRVPLWVAAFLLAAATSQAATLTITPDQDVYQVGDLITLNILGDAEGAADISVSGFILFEPDLADFVSSSQTPLESSGGLWDDTVLGGGEGFARAFSQLTVPFGTPLVPENLLEATVVLQATGVGVLEVDWSTEQSRNLIFFGLTDAPGVAVTIVPEPSTCTLLGLGLTWTAIGRRARMRSKAAK